MGSSPMTGAEDDADAATRPSFLPSDGARLCAREAMADCSAGGVRGLDGERGWWRGRTAQEVRVLHSWEVMQDGHDAMR